MESTTEGMKHHQAIYKLTMIEQTFLQYCAIEDVSVSNTSEIALF